MKSKTEKKHQQTSPSMAKEPSGYTGYATVSNTMLKECVDNNGMLSRAQADLLKLPWPLPQNWRELVIGKKISWNTRREAPKLKERVKPPKRSNRPPETDNRDNASRDSIVRSLGYASFGMYLRGEIFSIIRKRFARELGNTCAVCGGFASKIYHRHYSRENLSGKSLDGLFAMCESCKINSDRSKIVKESIYGSKKQP